MSRGSRAFAPGVGEEWAGDRVGAARERALVLAPGWACLYARGRARCAVLQVRVAADVRVLGPDSSVPRAVWPVGWSGRPGRALAREPGLRGARPAVGWRRLREGAQGTPAAQRGGGRAGGRQAGCARKVAGWALPTRVTSPGRPRGETRRLCGPAIAAPRGGRRWLVLEECGAPSAPCGWVLGRGLPGAGNRVLAGCAGRGPPRAAPLRCFVQPREGYSREALAAAVPASLSSQRDPSTSAILTRHLCALRKGILLQRPRPRDAAL